MFRSRLLFGSILVAALSVSLAPSASATPPAIPSKATAQSELNALTVAAEGSLSGYSRDEFPHWITISGSATPARRC